MRYCWYIKNDQPTNFQITVLNPIKSSFLFFCSFCFLFFPKLIFSISIFREKDSDFKCFQSVSFFFLRGILSSFCFFYVFLIQTLRWSCSTSSFLLSFFVCLSPLFCCCMFNWIDRNNINLLNVSIHVTMIINLIFCEKFIFTCILIRIISIHL